MVEKLSNSLKREYGVILKYIEVNFKRED